MKAQPIITVEAAQAALDAAQLRKQVEADRLATIETLRTEIAKLQTALEKVPTPDSIDSNVADMQREYTSNAIVTFLSGDSFAEQRAGQALYSLAALDHKRALVPTVSAELNRRIQSAQAELEQLSR